MKINPPRIALDENKPFENALFNREEFAKSLQGLLRNVSDNLVVFVNAPWGAGKTTFCQMWLAYLRGQKLEVIYYDAFASDYFDDPFVSFSGEILALVDKRLAEGKGLIERREFKKTAVEVGKRLAGLVTKVGIRAATLGAVESAHVDELKEIGSEIAKGVSDIGGDLIEKKIEHYAREKNALSAFKESLAKLAVKVREEQGFPLTIIVDELDRCRPDFALGLLERIKHLFDVEGVAFVLFVNQDQIENYIRAVYGSGVDARAYLLKFGGLFVDLPCSQPSVSFYHQPGRKEYCEILYSHHRLANRVSDGHVLINCTAVFCRHFDLTLREIEKVFAVMTIYYSSSPSQHIAHPFLVSFLSILKVRHPGIYQPLAKANISITDFFQQSGLKQIHVEDGEPFNKESFVDMLDYCLMSDQELESAISNTAKPRSRLAQMENWLGRNRRKVIPTLCWHLDRFSLRLE